MAVLFITHDFGVVAEIADRVLVLRHGRVVEEGPAAAVLGRPQAPYTRTLLSAVPTMDPPTRPPLSGPKAVEVVGLQKTYVTGGGLWRAPRRTAAARDVAFALHRGETLGLVGESGSGKSSVARLVMRLIEPDAGQVRLGDTDLTRLRGEALRQARSRIQMVFQDPFASLNPRRSVGRIIADGPVAHGVSLPDAMERARRLLDLVGLDAKALERFPHEFSGGQRQRIGIARALALEPEVLVADEAVSALDVSVQAQVLALLEDLKTRLGLSMLFITHDLRVAAQICDRIAVMRQGEIVELKTAGALFANPEHPYTRALLDAVPGRVRQAA
jgi:peptide/nickel transport system ATP-binding protein